MLLSYYIPRYACHVPKASPGGCGRCDGQTVFGVQKGKESFAKKGTKKSSEKKRANEKGTRESIMHYALFLHSFCTNYAQCIIAVEKLSPENTLKPTYKTYLLHHQSVQVARHVARRTRTQQHSSYHRSQRWRRGVQNALPKIAGQQQGCRLVSCLHRTRWIDIGVLVLSEINEGQEEYFAIINQKTVDKEYYATINWKDVRQGTSTRTKEINLLKKDKTIFIMIATMRDDE